MKTIFISKKPTFSIRKDNLQWILSETLRVRKGKEEWDDNSYFSNLSNLLDYLAETMFRKNTDKLKELKDLDESITKVYQLIDSVCSVKGGGGKSGLEGRWGV